ncbi:MAG: hypothetical protein A2Z14_16160 [Chloroflexi bacterium RBG_16_48_8]|nr:MAG: hypothetical protein A2Z14_16160 [Chloroflexi bacterium RBG_16_48_8]
MEITFLYFEDCPSHEEALDRLREVLQEEGIESSIEMIRVETVEQAQDHCFVGSPTILVDGQDIISPSAGTRYGLACRVYALEDGRISPLPSREMIRRALRSALDHAHE